MNKEIEEMASVMCGTKCSCKECIKTHAYNGEWFNCILPSKAEVLYNAGYRKADTVRKETAREIFNLLHESNDLRHIEYFIAQKYGVEVEERKRKSKI